MTIIRICRFLAALDVHSIPPEVQDVSEAWGTCPNEQPDCLREFGRLEDVLRIIAPQEMVAAGARSSPRRFTEMVAEAYDLGTVFYPGSRAMWRFADRIVNAKRFCSIEATDQLLSFHVLLMPDMFDEQRVKAPGIYKIHFSLSDFLILTRDLVEDFPGQSRTSRST